LKPLSDKELIVAFRNQPEVAFSAILKKYKEPVYFQCRRILVLHEDADDATQNTFVKVWRNLENFKGDSKFTTWLYRIAYNESLTQLKKQKKTQLESDDFDKSKMHNDSSNLDAETINALLAEALESLPEKQRMVFHYRYFEDLAFKQIAEIMETSEGGLKANYHHAVKKIKEKLQID